MSAMASKFADKEAPESSEDEDTSSFEEVQKPVERPTSTTTAPAPAGAAAAAFTGETDAAGAKATSLPASELKKQPEPESASAVDGGSRSVSGSGATAATAAGGLREVLGEIRGMLQSQGKQIEELTREVAGLKAKVGD